MVAKKALNIYEAKTQFSELIERARGGEEITISKNGKPVARIVPIEKHKPKRVFGLARGQIKMSPDWDSPETNREIEELFYGSDE
jgi:prevent-host-death family protein